MTGSRSAWIDRATLVLAAVAGASLMAMVALVTAAVVLRYAFGAPVLGVNEIVQLLAVAVAMLALPWCTQGGGHVRADVFDPWLGQVGRLAGDLMSRALSAAVLGVLAWRSSLKALDALEFGDATNMLGLPIWPFYGMISAGMALCGLILLAQIVALAVSGRAAS